jgi:ABC-type polysaccharide/polyol phosphate export permease
VSLFSDLRSSRELLVNLTSREVKGKYKRTALGQLWSLANPLSAMVVYTFVFAFIIKAQPAAGNPSGLNIFAVWLLCALLPWTFFTAVVNGGMNSLVGNENLIKKVYFPRSVLVVATGFASVYSWIIEMLVLVAVLLAVGNNPFPWLPMVVVVMALLFCFALGVSLLLSIANVYFRDTQHFVAILFQIWFYATPIVYPDHLVATKSASLGPLFGSVTLMDIYRLNPMENFAEVFRNLLYDGRMPGLSTLGACAGWSVAALLIGSWVFDRNSKKLAEAL